jgi:thiol-disulfide isomerase/thioredoxin
MNSKLTYFIVAFVALTLGFLGAKEWRVRQINSTALTAEVAPKARGPVLTLPEFSLQNRAGELQSIHSWPGKSLIINFWATWCAPCRREIPLLIELQQQHAADDVQLIGIAVDFRDDVLKYAETMKITYPLLIGEQDGMQAIDAFGIDAVGFPYTVFTDARGDIITMHIGELNREQAELILATVKRVNSGELTAGKARTELNVALSNMKAAVASDG